MEKNDSFLSGIYKKRAVKLIDIYPDEFSSRIYNKKQINRAVKLIDMYPDDLRTWGSSVEISI